MQKGNCWDQSWRPAEAVAWWQTSGLEGASWKLILERRQLPITAMILIRPGVQTETSSGSRPNSTPSRSIDWKVVSQSSTLGRPSSGRLNLNRDAMSLSLQYCENDFDIEFEALPSNLSQKLQCGDWDLLGLILAHLINHLGQDVSRYNGLGLIL